VFAATFEADNDPEDLHAYLATAYTPATQAAEISDAAVTTLLAAEGDDWYGFAQVRVTEVPDCVDDPTSIELWRLYVDPAWHGRGVAAALMEAACVDIASRGGRSAWLGVWERNVRAQRFYRKQGFEPVGTHTFVLGSDEQTDQIWLKRLPGP
jgi:ribosomal protein S18 acetylase RimI-like enzyme